MLNETQKRRMLAQRAQRLMERQQDAWLDRGADEEEDFYSDWLIYHLDHITWQHECADRHN